MSRFERAMRALSAHEGGYVNHPDDPGGATNKGVTQRTYDAYRRRVFERVRPVREITDAEVFDIYRTQYWTAVRAEELPQGLAYCVFDAAVNSGPARAAKWLQGVAGVDQDGIVGEQTLAAVRGLDVPRAIDRYCDVRLAFMKRLKHWPTFKNGWSRRVAEVRAHSKKWAAGYEIPSSKTPPQPKAVGPERLTATLEDAVKSKSAWATVVGTVGASGTLLSGDGPVQYAISAVLVIGALAGVWWLLRGRHE